MRVSGWARSQGGFIDDPARGAEDVNGSDTTGGRASFLVEATDDLSIRLSATMQDIESDAPNTANYFPDPLEPVAGDFDQFRGFPEQERRLLRYLQRNDRLGSRLGKLAVLDELQRARPG